MSRVRQNLFIGPPGQWMCLVPFGNENTMLVNVFPFNVMVGMTPLKFVADLIQSARPSNCEELKDDFPSATARLNSTLSLRPEKVARSVKLVSRTGTAFSNSSSST